MPITDLFKQLDTICVDTFGVNAVLYPKNGGEIDIKGIFAPPALMEEVGSGYGASVVRLFVRMDIDPPPNQGDTVIVGDETYDVFSVDADNAGSATLKMRKRAK